MARFALVVGKGTSLPAATTLFYYCYNCIAEFFCVIALLAIGFYAAGILSFGSGGRLIALFVAVAASCDDLSALAWSAFSSALLASLRLFNFSLGAQTLLGF